MTNVKVIAVIAVSVIIVIGLGVSFSSYMNDFENSPKKSDDGSQYVELKKIQPLGSTSAPLTILEIGDYQCEMCKLWFDKTRPLIIENYVNTGKANLVFLDMPFLGNDSGPAAQATYCADDQGMYWDYHVKLYQYQQHVDDGWANTERLSAIAFGLGLDIDEFNECMSSNKYFSHVNFNKKKSVTDFGAISTPTFIIIGADGEAKKLVGGHPYSTFEKTLNSLL